MADSDFTYPRKFLEPVQAFNGRALEDYLRDVGWSIVSQSLRSENWDGANPANLASVDSAATVGFYLDAIRGAAQFMGNLHIGGDLELTTGGVFRTDASGQRIEITEAEKNLVTFYSGDADEQLAGVIAEATNGTGGTRTLQFGVLSPYIGVNDQGVAMTVRSASQDGATPPGVIVATTPIRSPGAASGLAPIFKIQNGINMESDGRILLGAAGTAAAPLIGIGTNYDDGIYQVADGALGIALGGVSKFSLGTFFTSQPIYDNQAGTANVSIATNGRLTRITSAEKYKVDIRPAPKLADIDLTPVEYTSKQHGTHHYGLIADDVAGQLPDAGVYGVDGAVEDYDTRAVVAVLVAKINDLEQRVKALESVA